MEKENNTKQERVQMVHINQRQILMYVTTIKKNKLSPVTLNAEGVKPLTIQYLDSRFSFTCTLNVNKHIMSLLL